MGRVDTERQALNVARMRLLGAEVIAVDYRLAHPEGRDQRGVPRLGDQRRPHLLPASAPSAGPHPFPVMVRDFQRIIGLEARAQVLELDRPAARRGRRLRRRRLQRDRHLPRLPRRPRRAAGRLSRPAATASRPAGTPRPSPAARPACCTAPGRTCCRTRTGRSSSRTRSRRAWTTRASAPSTRYLGGHRPRRVPADHRQPRRWTRFALLSPHRGHHPGHRVGARGGRCARAGREMGPDGDRAGQPLRARRQGHGHRGQLVRTCETDGSQTDAVKPRSRRRDHSFDRCAVPTERAGRAGRLPARRLPDRAPARWTLDAAMVDGGCDLVEVGLPFSDPVHGRPGDPGRRRTRRCARRIPGARRVRRRRGRSPRPAAGPW